MSRVKRVSNNKWVENGRKYYYPECCINSFLQHRSKTLSQSICAVIIDIGFIPCEKHAIKILDGKYKNLSEIVPRETLKRIKLPSKLIPREKQEIIFQKRQKLGKVTTSTKRRIFYKDISFILKEYR